MWTARSPKRTPAVGSLVGTTEDFLLGGDPDNIRAWCFNMAPPPSDISTVSSPRSAFHQRPHGSPDSTIYTAAGVPPSIVTQPPATVTTNAGPIRLNLHHDQRPPDVRLPMVRANGTPVAGQTTTTLTFNPVGQANAGSYYAGVGRTPTALPPVPWSPLTVTGPPVVSQQSPTHMAGLCRPTPACAPRRPARRQFPINGPRTARPSRAPTPAATCPAPRPRARTPIVARLPMFTPPTPPARSAPSTVTVVTRPTAPYPVAVLNDHPVDYFRLDESPDNGTGNNGVPRTITRRLKCALYQYAHCPAVLGL